MPNYRNAYKSDHLSVIDLEEMIEQGKPLIFTIKQARQENTVVAGKKGVFNIAYFVEDIKPMVVNAGNSAIIRRLGKFGIDIDTWKDLTIELYIDQNVQMGGKTVGGFKVKTVSPTPRKQVSDVKALAAINAAKSTEELVAAWKSLTQEEQALPSVVAAKDKLKAAFAK